MTTRDPAVASLADSMLATMAECIPFWASAFGVPGYEDRVGSLSEADESTAAARLRTFARRAEQIEADGLDDDDRVTRSVLIHAARAAAQPLADKHVEFSLSGHMAPVPLLMEILANTTVEDDDQKQAYLTRLSGVATFLEQVGERAVAGAASGRVSTRRGVERTIERLTTYLDTPLSDDLAVLAARGSDIESRCRALADEQIRPAVAALADTLAGSVLPRARGEERCGLLHLPDGEEIYDRAVTASTSTTRSVAEFHQLGLDLCERLRDECAVLGERVFGTGEVEVVLDRLRHDTAPFESPRQILDEATSAAERAERALGDWFGLLPRSRCTVVPTNDVTAPTGVIAHYVPPSRGGWRPGRVHLNTHAACARHELETLTFHESLPGHHVQFALAQEVEHLPAFRRFFYFPAFAEGWALYAERLADEMGLYSSDLHRLGMVTFDMLRACRLVVDTGLHHYGWSREGAVGFMVANSALQPALAVNEVDRYIEWPGQALSYMVGRIEIEGLRSAAEKTLGHGFDVRRFHDAVLRNGGLPLDVLTAEIGRWVQSERPDGGPTTPVTGEKR